MLPSELGKNMQTSLYEKHSLSTKSCLRLEIMLICDKLFETLVRMVNNNGEDGS